ncbi:MAG TPA: NusG domain II-containing protein [bacterium]|nr:NusG domain II-containing protein [bacterium]
MKRILKILTRCDRILISGLLCGSLAGFLVLNRSGQEGTAAVITTSEGEIRKSLHENREISVHGPLGETHVVIHDHRVRIVSSPCPNKICVHMGAIHRAGEMVVCVPNRVVVRVTGTEDSAIDATTM